MKQNRMALITGLALLLASNSLPVAAQNTTVDEAVVAAARQVDERWQADRFGPIKSSDTLWSIAMYYSDNTDLSVYEMMDLFIELNPRAFVDNHPSHMLDGFYLRVPDVAQQGVRERLRAVQQEQQQQQQQQQFQQAEPQAEQNDADKVVFERNDLAVLRTQLAQSIELIEQLNDENAQLQERLATVSSELNQLRLKVDAEQTAEDELQQQIEAELAATKEAIQPSANQRSSQTKQALQSTSNGVDFVTWILQPLPLFLASLVVILVLVLIITVIYLRRSSREPGSLYHQAVKAADQEQQPQQESDEAEPVLAASPSEAEVDAPTPSPTPTLAESVDIPTNPAEENAFIEIETLLEEAEAAANESGTSRFERESGQVDDTDETPWGLIHLARFYLEVDDLASARAELEKVNDSDDDDAKREAAMLLQQIKNQERE